MSKYTKIELILKLDKNACNLGLKESLCYILEKWGIPVSVNITEL